MSDLKKLLGGIDKETFESALNGIQNAKERKFKPVYISFGNKSMCKSILWGCLLQVSDITKETFRFNDGILDVVKWMQDNKGLGLLITGNTGTGKTTVVKAILKAFEVFPVVFDDRQKKHVCKIIDMINAKDLVLSKDEADAKYSLYGDGGIGNRPSFIVQRKFFAIDDIGREVLKNDYGVRKNVMQDVIEDIDNRNKLCFMTSNLSMDELAKKYDDRAMDRIIKNFFIVELKGESLR